VKRRVMIVDDEALLARTLSHAFRDAGYDVATAGSAEQAEEILAAAERPFDLLILDNRLPGKSGLEMLAAWPQRARTRIVLMTAYDTAETHQRGVDLGVDLYLRKPFDLSTLLSQAAKLLEEGVET